MVVLMLCVWLRTVLAQESKVNLNALIQETQKMSEKADEMTLIWWLPEEYWRAVFAENPTVTESQAEEFAKVLRPYVFIVAVDGKTGTFGGITYQSEAAIRNSLQLIDNQGARYRPLSDEKIDADTKVFLSMIKPVLGDMLGPIGQNMHFFLFPSKDKKGQNIADTKQEGFFRVNWGEKEFKWRLPLGSLLPPKRCPVDGEKLNGAWKFCPWHGVKLDR